MLTVQPYNGGFGLYSGQMEIGWWRERGAALAARAAARYAQRTGADIIRIKLAAIAAATSLEPEAEEPADVSHAA